MSGNSPRPEVMPVGARSSNIAKWGLVCAAAAHVLYLGLLVTCDVLRVAPHGIVPDFAPDGVIVSSVQPGTISAIAGLESGDRLVRVNGQMMRGPIDWQWVRVNFDPIRPLAVEFDRRAQRLELSLPLSSGLGEWRTGASRPGLIAFRLVQIVTLSFALLVAFRRSSQPSALLGAWLLASFATISLVLPIRMFHLWRSLPQPLEALLWVPHATSAATGPLLFAFFAVFPRRTVSPRVLATALTPGALATSWFLFVGYHLSRPAGPPLGLPDLTMVIFAIGIAYALVAGWMLLAHLREAQSLTDRRRIQVLLSGLALSVPAGGSLLVLYETSAGADIFGNRLLTLLALFFLAGPASFAYAILRHRLFDLRLMVRQGVRYALARRLLNALIPILGAIVLAQVFIQRESLARMIESGWWWYPAALVTLVVIVQRRDAWLEALDRRFFRERYDANRLLESIATQARLAPSFDAIAPSVARWLDEALHPEFVDVLRGSADGTAFTSATTESANPLTLPGSLRTLAVLAALRQPLALSRGDTAWVRHQLPESERSLLTGHGVELLVPIFDEQDRGAIVALIVLGPKKSEEPYNADDMQLLSAIARALGTQIARHPSDERGFAACDECGRCFDKSTRQCATDGTLLAQVHGSRLVGRYWLERRLGRGGMGTVYEARDEVLERRVAVKLIREDLIGPTAVATDSDLSRLFLREARSAARLNHPNIVRIYDFGVDPGDRAYLVMERLEGETLRQLMESRGPIAPRAALDTLRDVCGAVATAHDNQIVHGDLKPENVFMHRGAAGLVPKVLDFGLAKTIPAVRTPRESSSVAVRGTLEYMAPEQIAGGEVSPSWDIWALGVIAYEMTTGRHPFRRLLNGEATPAATTDFTESDAEPRAASWLREHVLIADFPRRPATVRDLLAALEREFT